MQADKNQPEAEQTAVGIPGNPSQNKKANPFIGLVREEFWLQIV